MVHSTTMLQSHLNGFVPTVVGHGEDGDLGDGSVPALHSPGTLVDCGQICVHVSRETTTAGHLLSGCRHLENRGGG